MKNRPIIIVSISYIIGIIWGIYIKDIFLFFVVQIIILLIVCIVHNIKTIPIMRLINRKISIYTIIICIIFSILGLTNVYIRENKFNSAIKEGIFKATVISNCKKDEYDNRYIVKLDNYNINVYLIVNKNEVLKYGDYIYVKGKIEEPKCKRNWYGFDYKKYLKSINIVGSIDTEQYILIEEDHLNSLKKIIYMIKEKIREKIYLTINNDNKYLLEAFLIGDKDNISEDINETFRNSSLAHLLAISGTHIGIIIILISKLLSFIKLGKRNIYGICICILYMYMFIAGSTPSVRRICITTILIMSAKLIHEKPDISINIAISIMCILLENPFSIYNLSFILSYGGILGIIIYNILYKNDNNKAYIKNSFAVSGCIQLVLFPIMINSFNNISLTFFIANLFAIPLLSVILNLGIINIIISFLYIKLSYAIGYIINLLLDLLLCISRICGKLPLSHIYCVRIDISIILIYYIILVYLVYLFKIKRAHIIKHFFRKNYKNFIAIICIFVILINIYNYSGIKQLEIHFIDVGQGDATLIKTPYNNTILIDGGGSSGDSNSEVGKRILLPVLLNNKVRDIDYAIISHFDSDHIEGILYVMQEIRVKNVIIAKQIEDSKNLHNFLKIVKNKEINIILAKQGDRINIEKDLYFNILWPNSNNYISDNGINNNSLVCKLTYINFSMMFTGDIEKIAEEEIIDLYQKTNCLKSTVLKVAHHRF